MFVHRVPEKTGGKGFLNNIISGSVKPEELLIQAFHVDAVNAIKILLFPS